MRLIVENTVYVSLTLEDIADNRMFFPSSPGSLTSVTYTECEPALICEENRATLPIPPTSRCLSDIYTHAYEWEVLLEASGSLPPFPPFAKEQIVLLFCCCSCFINHKFSLRTGILFGALRDAEVHEPNPQSL